MGFFSKMKYILMLSLLCFEISQQKVFLVETKNSKDREYTDREYRVRSGDYQYVNPADVDEADVDEADVDEIYPSYGCDSTNPCYDDDIVAGEAITLKTKQQSTTTQQT